MAISARFGVGLGAHMDIATALSTEIMSVYDFLRFMLVSSEQRQPEI